VWGGGMEPRPETMTSWDDFDAYYRTTKATFSRIMSSTPDAQLYEPFTRAYQGETAETLSLADVLANLVLHERGHHGDISTLIHQLGGRPPSLDYRMYVYLKRNPS